MLKTFSTPKMALAISFATANKVCLSSFHHAPCNQDARQPSVPDGLPSLKIVSTSGILRLERLGLYKPLKSLRWDPSGRYPNDYINLRPSKLRWSRIDAQGAIAVSSITYMVSPGAGCRDTSPPSLPTKTGFNYFTDSSNDPNP